MKIMTLPYTPGLPLQALLPSLTSTLPTGPLHRIVSNTCLSKKI